MASANKAEIAITAVDQTKAAMASVGAGLKNLIGFADGADSAFQRLSGAGSILATLGAGLTLTGAATFIKSAADAADAMNDLSERTGLSVEALSKYQYAAKLSDLSNEDLQAGLNKLNKSIGENSSAFAKIGVSLTDSTGALRGNALVLEDVADKFAGMTDGAAKAALAQDLFGKSGTKLIPFLNQGRDGLKAMGDEAERLGIVMSTDLAARSAQLNDSLDKLGSMFDAVKINVGGALVPLLTSAAEQFMAVGGGADSMSASIRSATQSNAVRQWAQSAASAVGFVVDGFRGVTASVRSVGIAIAQTAFSATKLLSGEFGAAFEAIKSIPDEVAAAWDFDSAQIKVDTFFSEFDRSASISGQRFVFETAQQAATVQGIYDRFFAEQKKSQQDVTVFTDEQLKTRQKLSEQYAESQRRLSIGDQAFAVEKIKAKYAEQIAAIKGVANESAIRADLEKQQQAEIDAVYVQSARLRADLERGLTDTTVTETRERVAAALNGAQQVVNATAASGVRSSGLNDSKGTFQQNADAFWSDFRSQFSGFATGGQFTVGGGSGTDSQLVAFRASPGERVTIETPEQQSSGGISIDTINLPGISNARQFVAELREMLRADPGLLGTRMARAG